MKKYLYLSVCSILLMLILCGYFMVVKKGQTSFVNNEEKHNSYDFNMEKGVITDNPTEFITEDYTITDGFNSGLPIVVIDTNGVEPPISARYVPYEDDPTDGLFLPIEGVEPYVDGKIYVIDSEDGINTLEDIPSYEGGIKIKRRGNSSMSYAKAQWLIKLVTDSGSEYEADILGMGEDHEWILNGSMSDKSMLRNYIAYSTASAFMPYTPDSRYCEVLIKEGEEYKYQGVYMMMENIRCNENRVDITRYNPDSIFTSYLIRRDRYDYEAKMLDNYSMVNKLSDEYLSLLYPSKNKVTDDHWEYINADISNIEKIIYSDDPEVFATYSDVIDVDSFIDYFLINEFFGNYDAGNNSTYFYKEIGGKLCMGPVWDFDGAMDNYIYEAFDEDTIAFYTKPWFDRLCRDKNFIRKLEKRYIALRRTYLDERTVCNHIDDIVMYLGDAIDREWYRWGEWYTTNNQYSLHNDIAEDGQEIDRNTITYEEEISKIKTVIREHSKYIYDDIQLLEHNTVVDTGKESYMGWLLLLAAAIFLTPAIIVGFRK